MEPGKKPRCTSCGNLTRFDVTITRRTKEFHHFTVGGELTVESTEVLSETDEVIECHWCGPSGVIDLIENRMATTD